MRLLDVVQGEDRPSLFWGAWGQLWDAGMLLRRFSEPRVLKEEYAKCVSEVLVRRVGTMWKTMWWEK